MCGFDSHLPNMRKQYAGFIYCKKLNKKINISVDAVPHPVLGFICDCGAWVNDFTFGHDLHYTKE